MTTREIRREREKWFDDLELTPLQTAAKSAARDVVKQSLLTGLSFPKNVSILSCEYFSPC